MTKPGEVCIRGCSTHVAACANYGKSGAFACDCETPAPTVYGTLICASCNRRLRGMLRNASDLLGRMRTLASQGKAVIYSPVKASPRGSAPRDQITAELLDALLWLEAALSVWWQHFDRRTLEGLDGLLTDPRNVEDLWDLVLDRHEVDGEGHRAVWSLQDAADRWGIERRDRHVYPTAADAAEAIEVERSSVPEWYDRLLTTQQAAQLVGKTQRIIQKWIADGDLPVAMRVRLPNGTVIRSVYTSKVIAVATAKKPGRPRKELATTTEVIP